MQDANVCIPTARGGFIRAWAPEVDSLQGGETPERRHDEGGPRRPDLV